MIVIIKVLLLSLLVGVDSRSNGIEHIELSTSDPEAVVEICLRKSQMIRHGRGNCLEPTFNKTLHKGIAEVIDREVYEYDNMDDMMTFDVFGSASSARFHLLRNRDQTIDALIEGSRVEIKYTVICDRDYYGRSCSVYCATDEDLAAGRYTSCESDGRKTCQPGYERHGEVTCRRRDLINLTDEEKKFIFKAIIVLFFILLVLIANERFELDQRIRNALKSRLCGTNSIQEDQNQRDQEVQVTSTLLEEDRTADQTLIKLSPIQKFYQKCRDIFGLKRPVET